MYDVPGECPKLKLTSWFDSDDVLWGAIETSTRQYPRAREPRMKKRQRNNKAQFCSPARTIMTSTRCWHRRHKRTHCRSCEPCAEDRHCEKGCKRSMWYAVGNQVVDFVASTSPQAILAPPLSRTTTECGPTFSFGSPIGISADNVESTAPSEEAW